MNVLEVDAPVGRVRIVGDGAAITAVHILSSRERPAPTAPEPPGEMRDAPPTGAGASDPLLERAASQLSEYFAGTRWDFDLPLRPIGTAFQQRVWGRIADIPWGHAMSYGRLGADLGLDRTASRAVGTAVGANPITILIPCHRVLAADGRITGYSGGDGIPTKQTLLDLEGIPYR